jgi:hypothetical protein
MYCDGIQPVVQAICSLPKRAAVLGNAIQNQFQALGQSIRDYKDHSLNYVFQKLTLIPTKLHLVKEIFLWQFFPNSHLITDMRNDCIQIRYGYAANALERLTAKIDNVPVEERRALLELIAPLFKEKFNTLEREFIFKKILEVPVEEKENFVKLGVWALEHSDAPYLSDYHLELTAAETLELIRLLKPGVKAFFAENIMNNAYFNKLKSHQSRHFVLEKLSRLPLEKLPTIIEDMIDKEDTPRDILVKIAVQEVLTTIDEVNHEEFAHSLGLLFSKYTSLEDIIKRSKMIAEIPAADRSEFANILSAQFELHKFDEEAQTLLITAFKSLPPAKLTTLFQDKDRLIDQALSQGNRLPSVHSNTYLIVYTQTFEGVNDEDQKEFIRELHEFTNKGHDCYFDFFTKCIEKKDSATQYLIIKTSMQVLKSFPTLHFNFNAVKEILDLPKKALTFALSEEAKSLIAADTEYSSHMKTVKAWAKAEPTDIPNGTVHQILNLMKDNVGINELAEWLGFLPASLHYEILQEVKGFAGRNKFSNVNQFIISMMAKPQFSTPVKTSILSQLNSADPTSIQERISCAFSLSFCKWADQEIIDRAKQITGI